MNGTNPPHAPVFEIQKLYLKDVSFESPHAPVVFMQAWQPEINVQLGSESTRLDEDIYEVVLSLTVTARQNDKAVYLVELKQAGVFTLKGFAAEQQRHLLGSYCPNTLFPFARETIAGLIAKGGFPHLLLAPVNFDVLHAQQQQRLAQQANIAQEAALQQGTTPQQERASQQDAPAQQESPQPQDVVR